MYIAFIHGRGQPLYFTLLFGETPWFDVHCQIRRCDWLKIIHSLYICIGYIRKHALLDQSHRRI
jgi:hypothetical protein